MSDREAWRKAWEWIRRYGDQTPDALNRARDHLLRQAPRIYTPRPDRMVDELLRFQWAPIPRPTTRDDQDMSKAVDFRAAYRSFPDFMQQYQGTFDSLDNLPDSFSGQVGQQGKVDWAEKELKSLIKQVDAALIRPKPRALYVDPDGTEHAALWLEDRPEGEVCLTCGAYWQCDCSAN